MSAAAHDARSATTFERCAYLGALFVALGACAPARAAAPSIVAKPTSSAHGAAHHPPVDIDWQTSPLDLDLRGMNGERYTFHCPPGKPVPARIVGSGPYADNASICGAAVF